MHHRMDIAPRSLVQELPKHFLGSAIHAICRNHGQRNPVSAVTPPLAALELMKMRASFCRLTWLPGTVQTPKCSWCTGLRVSLADGIARTRTCCPREAAEHVEQIASSPRCRAVSGAFERTRRWTCCIAAAPDSTFTKMTVVVTLGRVGPAGKVFQRTKTFPTMTRDLLALSDWLAAGGDVKLGVSRHGAFGGTLNTSYENAAGALTYVRASIPFSEQIVCIICKFLNDM